MPDNALNERDSKLVQWLNEAYAKEAELEVDLAAHIRLTRKESYKKRLREHLSETKDHKKQVAGRIRALGGRAEARAVNLPGVPTAVGEVAGKTLATVKGQVGTARALLTKQVETHLRNAQEELREENVEMALYRRIETFASEVGDRETIQLARRILREEDRMAAFLSAEIERLVKELVRAEIPRDQRAPTAPSRRSSTGRKAAGSRSTLTSRSAPSRSSRGASRATGSGPATRARSTGSSTRSTGSNRAPRSGGASSPSGRSGRSSPSRSSNG